MEFSKILANESISLIDQNPEYKTKRKIGITGDSNLVSVEVDGHNNCVTCDNAEFGKGHRAIVSFEVWEGELRCLVWADINQEDPTHVISLDGAKVSCR